MSANKKGLQGPGFQAEDEDDFLSDGQDEYAGGSTSSSARRREGRNDNYRRRRSHRGDDDDHDGHNRRPQDLTIGRLAQQTGFNSGSDANQQMMMMMSMQAQMMNMNIQMQQEAMTNKMNYMIEKARNEYLQDSRLRDREMEGLRSQLQRQRHETRLVEERLLRQRAEDKAEAAERERDREERRRRDPDLLTGLLGTVLGGPLLGTGLGSGLLRPK